MVRHGLGSCQDHLQMRAGEKKSVEISYSDLPGSFHTWKRRLIDGEREAGEKEGRYVDEQMHYLLRK